MRRGRTRILMMKVLLRWVVNQKKIICNNTREHNKQNYTSNGLNNAKEVENYEVCITSKTALPKSIGLAKLLKSENINNICRIKYKSQFKVYVQLDNMENTNKLLNSQKFKDLDFRCQRTDQLNTTFGIVKNIDLVIGEKELTEIFQSDVDIMNLKRLKRLASEGKWVDSEVVRIEFKGANLPEYVYSYECRFKVEPYIFPVSQCSGCWKFGHIKKYCSTKRIVCPKCGQEHENCPTENYFCINCKGPHMALNKKCPVYLKEKTIRKLMSENSCTYKKGLELYLNNYKPAKDNISMEFEMANVLSSSHKTYTEALKTQKTLEIPDRRNQQTLNSSLLSLNDSEGEIIKNKESVKKQSTRKQKKKNTQEDQLMLSSDSQQHMEEDIQHDNEGKHSRWRNLYNKLRDLKLSKKSLEEKVKKTLQIIFEEIIFYAVFLFKDFDVTSKIFSMFNYG